MLQKMLAALSDMKNGVTQDVWAHIVAAMGSSMNDIAILERTGINCFGGRYYLTDNQRRKLREMLPFMAGVNLDRIGGGTLALPAHEPEPDWDCAKCGFVVNKIPDGAFMAYVCRNEQCKLHDLKIRYTIEKPMRCSRCKGPFHPATGHQFSVDTVACGICYGKFAAWQLANKFGHTFLSPKQKKRIDNKIEKAKKKAAKQAKALMKLEQEKKNTREKVYGIEREAQEGNSAKIIKFPQPVWE